jgi:carbamoyltransferase
VDGTGRVQTVTREANGRLHALIERFYARTGVPLLLNTSFNVANEPLVETPEDALFCLLFTDIDACVLGDRIVRKQPGYRSILDLVVEVIGEASLVGCPGEGGERGEAGEARLPRKAPVGIALDAERVLLDQMQERDAPYVRIEVSTPWGPAVQLAEPAVRSLLRRADGQATGREILERLSASGGGAIDEAEMIRALGGLRRARIIALRAPRGGPASRGR